MTPLQDRAWTGGEAALGELEGRGLVHDHTDPVSMVGLLDSPTSLYCGFDPTADSLHIGNLQSIMLLRRFQEMGHQPVALIGGATGMIGDPSGRSDERQFLDPDLLDANRTAIGAQLSRFLDFDAGPRSARLVDNRTWTESVTILEFLRDVGKHVTVNTMMSKDSVKSRLDRESGISFTEFSYMLLQAHDYLVLHETHGVDLQVAGSDQWGNIVAGVDLIRRRTGNAVHGLTAPLIVRSDGSKFGKSEGQNIWLSSTRTSAYQMYQYFMNVTDDDVLALLLRLTLLSIDECGSVASSHQQEPHRRLGQRRLAAEITALVHGASAVADVEAATDVLFGGSPIDAGPAVLDLLAAEIPHTRMSRADVVGTDAVELFAATGAGTSRSEVRRNASGHHVNQVALSARQSDVIEVADLLFDRFLLLRKGKRSYHLVVVSEA